MDIDRIVEKKLKAKGLVVSDLTEEELKRLREEVASEKNGIIVLDGVLSNPQIIFRKLKKNK